VPKPGVYLGYVERQITNVRTAIRGVRGLGHSLQNVDTQILSPVVVASSAESQLMRLQGIPPPSGPNRATQLRWGPMSSRAEATPRRPKASGHALDQCG